MAQSFPAGKDGTCENVTLSQVTNVGGDPGLLFIDDNALIWYQQPSGVLVQAKLFSRINHFFESIEHAPEFPGTCSRFSK
jgi:hypothetical protein